MFEIILWHFWFQISFKKHPKNKRPDETECALKASPSTPKIELKNVRNHFATLLVSNPSQNSPIRLESPSKNECTLQASLNTPQIKFKHFEIISDTPCFKSHSKTTPNLSTPSRNECTLQASPNTPQIKIKHIETILRLSLFQKALNNHPKHEHPDKKKHALQASPNSPQIKFKMFEIMLWHPLFQILVENRLQDLSASTNMSAHSKPHATLPKSKFKHLKCFCDTPPFNPLSESIHNNTRLV